MTGRVPTPPIFGARRGTLENEADAFPGDVAAADVPSFPNSGFSHDCLSMTAHDPKLTLLALEA